MPAFPKHVAIVGGGITGLTAAYSLLERAKESHPSLTCTVVEAESQWGGKILTHRVGDLTIEAGPDSFLSQKPWALELCAKLGLSEQLINTNELEKKAFVFSRGRLRELPEGLVVIVPSALGTFLRGGLVSLPGLCRMALDLALPAKRSPGDESLASFFRRRVGREAFERVIEPLMAGIYAGDAEQMSVQSTFPRFVEMEQQGGSLIRGMLASGRGRIAAGKPGAPTRTMFVTLRDGLGLLVETLIARIKSQGATLMSGERVGSLSVRSDQGTRVAYELVLHSGKSMRADAVVLAAPAYETAELVRPLAPSAADLLSDIPYASTATVSLAYDWTTVRGSVCGFGFVVPRVERRHLLAATWTSLKWAHRAPTGQVLVRCYLGGVGREAVLAQDDATLVTLVREELAAMAGIAAEPFYREVNRWPRGMPQYTVGHLDRLRKIEQEMEAHPGLFLTGAAYRGIGIPDCIRDGEETAGRVARDLVPAQV